MRRRILNLLISLDQFLFCWLSLGYYHPDATLSAQAYEWHRTGKRSWPMRLIDFIFSPFEKEHCLNAWWADRGLYV